MLPYTSVLSGFTSQEAAVGFEGSGSHSTYLHLPANGVMQTVLAVERPSYGVTEGSARVGHTIALSHFTILKSKEGGIYLQMTRLVLFLLVCSFVICLLQVSLGDSRVQFHRGPKGW